MAAPLGIKQVSYFIIVEQTFEIAHLKWLACTAATVMLMLKGYSVSMSTLFYVIYRYEQNKLISKISVDCNFVLCMIMCILHIHCSIDCHVVWHHQQWCNRWGRGQSSPLTFFTGKFLLTYWEKGARKKGKMERKRRKIWKGGGGKLKTEGKRYENEQRTLFFSSFFFLSLFETTENCLGLPKWAIFTREIIFYARKKLGKLTLPSLKNSPLMPLHQIQ